MNCQIISECIYSEQCKHKDVAEYCSIARDRKKGMTIDAIVFEVEKEKLELCQKK
jgi:hypothetical protein